MQNYTSDAGLRPLILHSTFLIQHSKRVAE